MQCVITEEQAGTMCLEVWNGPRKLSLYVSKDGIQDCLVVSEAGEVKDAALDWALKFVGEHKGVVIEMGPDQKPRCATCHAQEYPLMNHVCKPGSAVVKA